MGWRDYDYCEGSIGKFRFPKKSKRTERFTLNRWNVSLPTDDPPLTGWVQGQQASDIEERVARSLDAEGLAYSFNVPIATAVSLPGEKKVVDFLIHDLGIPLEVDGEIGHKTQAQQGNDTVRDLLLNPVLARDGFSEIVHLPWWKLDTQEETNVAVREL